MRHQMIPRIFALVMGVAVAGCYSPRTDSGGDDDWVSVCTSAEDCESGEHCYLGRCTTGTSGDYDATGDSPGVCDCRGLQTCDAGVCVDAEVCFNDGDCIAPRACVGGNCVDAPDCRTDGDCGSGEICFEETFTCGEVPCVDDGDCPGALRCTGGGICVECLADGDCPGTQVCPFSSCDEGASCTVDIDCVRGRVCSVGACEDPTCIEEASEPNETFATAGTLAAGEQQIHLCFFDTDTYALPVAVGDGLLVRINYDPALGDLEATLFDGDEEELDFDEGFAGRAVLSFESSSTAGAYLVLFSDSALLMPVDVTVAVFSGGVCLNDELEPNDVEAEISPLADNVTGVPVRLCTDDTDWFAISVPSGGALTVTVNTASGEPPIAELRSADALLLRDSSDNTDKTLSATNSRLIAATYQVMLQAVGAAHIELSTEVQ